MLASPIQDRNPRTRSFCSFLRVLTVLNIVVVRFKRFLAFARPIREQRRIETPTGVVFSVFAEPRRRTTVCSHNQIQTALHFFSPSRVANTISFLQMTAQQSNGSFWASPPPSLSDFRTELQEIFGKRETNTDQNEEQSSFPQQDETSDIWSLLQEDIIDYKGMPVTVMQTL